MRNPLYVLSLLCCLFVSFCSAQTVKVKKEASRIKGENIEGYAVDVEGASQDVSTAFLKYLKALGKVKQSNDMFLLTESSTHGSNTKIPIYGIVKDKGGSSTAWLGIKGDEWPSGDVDKVNKDLEKLAYEFGVKFYKDKIQMQIDESNQAYQAVEKQQQRLTNENHNLKTKLEFNEQQKVRLEKSLENNKLEHEELLKRIEKNKHDQDSVAVAGQQIKKVIETHKDKQSKVK